MSVISAKSVHRAGRGQGVVSRDNSTRDAEEQEFIAVLKWSDGDHETHFMAVPGTERERAERIAKNNVNKNGGNAIVVKSVKKA